MTVSVLGAGAFGTALAISLAQNGPVTLWARDGETVAEMARTRQNQRRLPGATLPAQITVTTDLAQACTPDVVLLAIPAQKMSAFLRDNAERLAGKTLVSCAKGIDLQSGKGPSALISEVPGARPAVLTGPSFAADIARGLPTALTLACEGPDAAALQTRLSTPNLRLYRCDDLIGAELGGALKNVIAIGAGVVIGAGLGDSARAALITRGFAEMNRLAIAMGAHPETLSGLSGLGDLVLTCTSSLSRNFRHGQALGAGQPADREVTVEGVATARAVTRLAQSLTIEMPIAAMVAALAENRITVTEAAQALLSRPLKEE